MIKSRKRLAWYVGLKGRGEVHTGIWWGNRRNETIGRLRIIINW